MIIVGYVEVKAVFSSSRISLSKEKLKKTKAVLSSFEPLVIIQNHTCTNPFACLTVYLVQTINPRGCNSDLPTSFSWMHYCTPCVLSEGPPGPSFATSVLQNLL